jgi:putative endonuclease
MAFGWFRRKAEDRSAAAERGRAGEDAARRFLEGKGFKFLRANYRTRFGEVDLVMEDGESVVFVEVKARGDARFAAPQESVTRGKQRRVVTAALAFLKEARLAGRPLRFDVVTVMPEGTEHIPDAFGAGGSYTI